MGLWAFPLPMDYDGDGDLDLLVACPDKPSNGVYFFENPDGSKDPVFKPGRRLGKADQHLTVSHVDGKPRILKPAWEFVDFQKKGFDKPTKLFPESNIHDRPVRSNQWRYVDFNGDGKQDLVVGVGDWTEYGWDAAHDSQGRWRNGPLRGFVYILLNTGSNESPSYAPKHRLQAGRGDLETYGWPSPNFADFDGDGDLDLICGEFLDAFTYYENVGSRKEPRYSTGRKLTYRGQPIRMDLQMIVPSAIDWDKDGDVDLIVGDEDGRVALVEHTGKVVGGLPQFLPPKYFRQQAHEVKCGALATPFAVDWDGDGDVDLVSGNTAGYFVLYENLDGQDPPTFAAPRLLEAGGEIMRVQAGPSGSIQGPCEAKWGYTNLSVADWDGDGLLDVISNSIWGKVVWHRNIGSKAEPKLAAAEPIKLADTLVSPKPAWTWWTPSPGDLVTVWRTLPLAVDSNYDGLMDLVTLDPEGTLVLYRRQQRGKDRVLLPAERIFVDEQGASIALNPKTIGKSGRTTIAMTDWDGDGRVDLIVNSTSADWWRNCQTLPDGKIVLKKIGPLAKQNISGHNTCPTVVDWDKDGKPDLVVGAEDGHFYYLRHKDAIQYPADQLPAKYTPPTPAGAVRKVEKIFETAPFKECHASTLIETPAGLVAAWFAGTKEKNKDVCIWVSRHDGKDWLPMQKVAEGVQYDGHRHPCWNPVLFQPTADSPLSLYYKVGPSPSEWWGMVTTSVDCGRLWSTPTRLAEHLDGPVKNKAVVLADGTYLFPSSTEDDGWRVHFERSADQGKTWSRIGPLEDPLDLQGIQPTVLQHADGKLRLLCRTKRQVIGTATSSDGGKTWSPLEKSSLPNPNSGIDAVTLTDGRHLLVYNHTPTTPGQPKGREIINVALSPNGVDWQQVLTLDHEPKAEFSYPCVIQTRDGLVHIGYTDHRKTIKHVVVDPKRLDAE